MKAEPAFLGVQGNEEEIRVLQIAEDARRMAGLGEVITQRGRESVENRYIQHEIAEFVSLSTEHFFGEVFANEAVIAAEVMYEFAWVCSACQSQGGQVKACWPALGPLHEFENSFAG